MASNKPNEYAKFMKSDDDRQLSPNSPRMEAAALGFIRSSSSPTNTSNLRPGFPFAVPMEYPLCSPRPRGKASSVFGASMQGGFVSLLYAIAENPLELWEKQIRNGTVKRVIDTDIRSKTIEILNPVSPMSTFITTPAQLSWTLGIRLPVMVLVVKNLKRYFTFEIQVLDDTKTRRRFRARYLTDVVSATPAQAALPLRLEDGWNQVSMNLSELTQKVYGTLYVETVRVQIYGNTRIRRIFFCDKLYGNQEVPADFKIFVKNSTRT